MTRAPGDGGGEGAAPLPSAAMSPQRWHAVDAILQSALQYDRDRRDAFVAGACHDDAAMRREIVSLLEAHDAAPADFLERPAFEALARSLPGDEPPAPDVGAEPHRSAPPSRRTVSARAAVYVATGTMLFGLLGGWGIAHGSLGWPWPRSGPAPQSTGAIATVQPTTGGTDGLSLAVVDRTGNVLRTIPADRPWTPRFSPDGRQVAYGAFGGGRQTSDLWVTRVDDGSTRRLTDDDADSNDPQWSPDGTALAYSVGADGGKDVAERPLGDGGAHVLAARPGTQYPSDWRRDGSALLVTEEARRGKHDILVQPDDGSAAKPYAATDADERSARFSPDGKWVAYTSDESGRAEVYLDSFDDPGQRVLISNGGGSDPVWRADGREIYYWHDDDLVAVRLDPGSGRTPPKAEAASVLFRAPYQHSVNTMYDASPDGQRFVVVIHR